MHDMNNESTVKIKLIKLGSLRFVVEDMVKGRDFQAFAPVDHRVGVHLILVPMQYAADLQMIVQDFMNVIRERDPDGL